MKNLSGIKCFLFDLDGTVYVGGKLIPGALETVNLLRARAKLCFLTNNSGKSRGEYLQKLRDLGLSPSDSELIISTDTAVKYLLENHSGKSVYFVGRDAVAEDLAEAGLRLTKQSPDIVLLSYDTTLDYSKLCDISLHLSRGAVYVATHPDVTCPAEPVAVPDVGSFMELIYAATGRRADAVCGKPSGVLAELVKDKFGLQPHEIAMVGDRQATDMQFAMDNGFASVLVLTGVTTRQNLEISPDFVLESIAELPNLL